MNSPKWSEQQEAIFKWFESGSGNLVVRARAGTGKTTTIHEGIARAPEGRILLAAFNKSIATESQKRLANPRAVSKTLHATGLALITRANGRVNVDGERGKRIAADVCGPKAPDVIVGMVTKLAGLGKNIVPFAQQASDLEDIAESFDLVPDEMWAGAGWKLDRVCRCAVDAMKEASERKDGTIDFDDMVWLPVVNNYVARLYDLVVVDECQDMDVTQIELGLRICDGRIVVVGDDRQAIYSFRGADSGSLDRLKKELKAVEMPLTITYRCPKTVVALAKEIVPDYQAAPTAPEGAVLGSDADKMLKDAGPGDFVLSRKNAPLVGYCLDFLKAGKRAKVKGKDISKGLLAIVRKLAARSIPEFLEKLEAWTKRTVERLSKNEEKNAAKIEQVMDQSEVLEVLATGLSSVRELEVRIDDLFSDDVEKFGAFIVLSTVHKAKGLESNRVWMLIDTFFKQHAGGSPRPVSIEEKNIEYVAITRAKDTLMIVRDKE